MCGTHEYMPPEMIRGKAYNQAVDWWALGALIFEMVTGYPPFQHKNRKKLHHKILNEKVRTDCWHLERARRCSRLMLLLACAWRRHS